MKLIKSKKGLALLAATVATLVAAVAAYAFWTTGGSGSGSAATASSTAVTISQDGSVGGLYPDGPAQKIDFTIHNTNPSKLRVTSLTIAVADGWTSHLVAGGAPDCTAADFVITQPTGFPTEVNGSGTNGGATSFPGSVTGASIQLKDTALNQDECQGVTVPLTFTAS